MDQAEPVPENSMIGRRVGVYRLEEEVGRGGMGVVYRAERVDGEFAQTVAIKLIKRGMDTDQILKRFRRERQITAALNHPNIAYFLGGGSTEDGLPYFVMEYIVGRPLYQYCDEKRLNIRQRLTVFRSVCWALGAAHELKVIHRDLKPSNVLVTEEGKPKLLDFGIAKVLDPDLMETDGEPTATQLRVMTPEYASPEQITGEPIDAPSDVYSLGVILYELLTGHRPYEFKRNLPDDLARAIREQPPTTPSGSLSREATILPMYAESQETLNTIFRSRNSSLESLRMELRGDLDRIVLKTLRKDPAERYRTVAELADDITNFLEGRPVNAEAFPVSGVTEVKPSARTSLAILPFKMLGGPHADTGDGFFGVGLADALVTRLSGVGRIVIRPTSSVLPFAESDSSEAGQKLGVDYVLDGNVRQAGNRLRVSVQLLEVGTRSTKWAHAFDEDVRDLLELEDRLSEQVAKAVLPEITGDERKRLERRGTNKPEAYKAYLRGRYFWSKFTDAYLLKAVEAFNEAVSIDPDYPLPYIGLADYYVWSAIFGEIPTIEGFSKAQAALHRALEIDDTLGEAYAVLAFTVLLFDWNWPAAEALVKQALELNPNNPFAYECYSNFLSSQGRFDEAITAIKRAEELDPVSPRAILMTSWTLYQARRFDEAAAAAKKANAMQENFSQGNLHLGNALIEIGELDEAVIALRQSAEIWGRSGMPRYMLAFARARQNNREAVESILEKLRQTESEHHMKAYFMAMAYAAAGAIDLAFEWFEKATEERNEWMVWFGVEPKLDVIRNDRRYRVLLEKTKNPIAHAGASQDTGERQHSIAVLPFRNVGTHDPGGQGAEEYLSLGIADAVTMRLSNVRRFLVRPTSSVLPFAGGMVDPFKAGRDLGVEYVVDGIIRHIGDRIRVTAQLLSVEQASTLWSAGFLEKSSDILDLEDSISRQVTERLVPQLTGEERQGLARRGTDIAEAHDAYLQGRYFWNQFTPESFAKSIAAFQKAVELDPNYAVAHVGIADYYTWASIYGFFPPSLSCPKVLESATRALEIDLGLAEAHAALGLYYSNMQLWEKAEDCYRKAVELNANYPLGHEWLSSVLLGTGRFEEGTKEIIAAERLDPLSLRPKVLSAWHFYQMRDYPEALAKAEEIRELSPEFMQGHLQAANILLEMGQNERALKAARRAAEIDPASTVPLYVLAFALAANGLRDELNELIRSLETQDETNYVVPYFIGMAHLAAGNTDAALEYLKNAVEEKSAWVIWLGTEPKMDAIRAEDRYRSLLDKSGLRAIEPSAT
jgi:serine/threonine protein kinase/tetratricopeptide (TPR) repeat protein